MPIALYDATVDRFLQGLGGVADCLERGSAFFAQNNIDLDDVVRIRIWEDMLPFSYQVMAAAHHSLGAIEGVQRGTFSPPETEPRSYAELQSRVSLAQKTLQALTRDDVNAYEGKELIFKVGDQQRAYAAESFLLSFSLPNFYFHAATAYDILRSKGVPLGKREFLGRTRKSF